MGNALKLVQVADSAAHAAAVLACFEKSGFAVQSNLLATPATLDTTLNGHSSPFVIFHSSGSLRETSSILDALQRHASRVPCVVVVDTIDQSAVDFMKAGARDCISRNDTPRLQTELTKIARLAPPSAARDQALEALRESEEKFSRIFHTSPDSITITRISDGVYLDVNAAFTRVLGYTRAEIVGRQSAAGDQGIWVNASDRARLIEGLKAKGEVVGLEAPFRTKDGRVVIALMSARVLQFSGVTCILAFTRDITERRQIEHSIKEREEKFSRVFHISPDSININQLKDGKYLDVNEGFTQILGYTREEVVGKNSTPGNLGIWVNQCDRDRLVAGLKSHGEVVGLEASFRAKDGHIVTGLMSARILKLNGVDCILSFTRDITARKHAEMERDATIRLLHICNQAVDLKELAQELTLFFKQLTNCEAVGLRLRDGPDYPYFETHGFSNEFVQAERHLCSYQTDGKPVCDDLGNPILACMCGNILQGRFDPTKPFFTKRGSFWTNSTTKLLASTTETEHQTQARNRCTAEGYESIALIPLRSRPGTIGLLQLNHRQKDQFSPALIELIETLAEYVTVALEKLRSEQALRTSEEHLRQMLETTEAGYCFIDSAGKFQKVNNAWLRLHGYEKAEEVIGQHFSITQVEADQATAQANVEKLLSGVHLPPSDFTRKRKDGSIGYHTFTVHQVKEGSRVIGIEGFLIDTTGLLAMREQYSMLFDQMLDGFVLHEMIFDPDGQPVDYCFIAMNPAFEQMTGLKTSSCIGRTAREILPGLEAKWLKTYGDVVKTGEPKRFEDFSRELNKHFEILAFRPTEGRFACLVRDVSARKQLELQLLHSQKMDAVGQLAGGVAHDFNNFLAAIMMHLSLLQRTPGMGGEVKESLKELESEAKRAAGLTRQLLMFSRREVMQLSATDLNDLLTNLLKMLRRLIGEHIKLIFASEATPLWIEADPGMIEQVVMNLCVNARDAMPRGGDLKIEASSLQLASTEHLGDTENRSGNFVCLTVTDNGSGMTQETLSHIFEPFFTTKEPGKGTGLGLATVYSIVKQHRGWINVHSTPGHGSTFRIFLPAIRTPSPEAHSSTQNLIQGGSEGILVVEDDVGFRNLVGMSLKVLGYRVFEAVNGREAYAIWEARQPEIGLLFADQVLPGGMTGLELGQQLRADKPALRMIITTGYLGDSIKPEQLAAESIVFLPKPFTAEALAAAVRQCLDDTSAKE